MRLPLIIVLGLIVGACQRPDGRVLDGVAAAAAESIVTTARADDPWPNEPKGFVRFDDQPWDHLTLPREPKGPVGQIVERLQASLSSKRQDGPWSYLRRSSSKYDGVVSDARAPFSPPNVLRIVFTPDMRRDSEPGVHWIRLPGVNEIYTAWWMKLSPNWRPSPAGGGKITFLWPPNGHGVTYSNIGGSSAPHRINLATTWSQYGYRFWEPNLTATPISYDRWYRIEWYVKWESKPEAADGMFRWWVDGVPNGDYRNVQFPPCCMMQFEFAPTLQNPPPAEQYMYIDHTYLSTAVAK
jgi:hypothetical protein